MNYKGIWFFGLSGSGKTTSAEYIKNNIFKNSLLLDGDLIRKFVSYDLNYSIEDRRIQIRRILGICKICINSEIFPVCSSVYMNQEILDELINLQIKPIKIERDFNKIKNSDIYNSNSNVIGMDLNYEKTFNVKIIKNENLTDLFLELELIFKYK